MMKSFYCWWILLITIGEFLQYGQTQILRDDDLDPLTMDQAYLNITNENYSQPIIVQHNLVVCEKCDYELLTGPLAEKNNNISIINTKYPHEFQLYIGSLNKTVLCKEKSYSFVDGGFYLFQIISTEQNESACVITPQDEPILRYWLPVILGFVVLLIFTILTQIWHCLSQRPGFVRLLPEPVRPELTIHDFTTSLPRTPGLITNDNNDDIIDTLVSGTDMPLTASNSVAPNSLIRLPKALPKRLRALDTFRGFSLMVMIFVNYGGLIYLIVSHILMFLFFTGGGYSFFHHSIWNGLTIADLVFPWFVWMMGVSIVLSQRSLRAKNVRKATIFFKIFRRTLILFMLGLILQGGWNRFVFIRIFGVLQRLAMCYFFAAVLVLIFDDKEDEPYRVQWPTNEDVHQPLRSELRQTLFHFWPQWLFISLTTLVWVLITFIPKFEKCPSGYLGPGGKHDHSAYQNCTGGIAGYIDREVLQSYHVFNHPTCKDIYGTQIPFDPEGLLGILTGTLLCYLGVQAGHSFAHSTSIGRVCGHWLISGVICGTLGLILSKGGQSDSWIPINKNLWSLSFILVLAGLAFVILTILYLLVDVYKWFTGEPFIWLGMNSIVIYVGHESCAKSFPIQFQVEETTHAQLLAMHLYGALFWTIVAGLMYRKKFFIAI